MLDVDAVRSHFPAFALAEYQGQSFFENAGGSLACRQTIDALTGYYTRTKVQPYAEYGPSAEAGRLMDASHHRWAEALGVATDEVAFGPSTSMNTYVIAKAFGEILGPGDEIVVTNQDHEANTGAVRRMAEATGATLREWRVDPATGLLDTEALGDLLNDRTRLVCFPHCSNIVGQENPVTEITTAAHAVGARTIVDGVSFAPHGLADVAALDADIYLFSLYKVYSVHQGLLVARNGVLDELPNQGHWFNAEYPAKRLTPAGPDHAQVASAGAVLDYVQSLHTHHGGAADASLREAAESVSRLWQEYEHFLVAPVLDFLAAHEGVRLIGPATTDAVSPELHRCPTVAFVPRAKSAAQVAHELVERGVMCSNGDFYAVRLLDALDVDLTDGVVRVSWVHYTSRADIDRLLQALADVLG